MSYSLPFKLVDGSMQMDLRDWNVFVPNASEREFSAALRILTAVAEDGYIHVVGDDGSEIAHSLNRESEVRDFIDAAVKKREGAVI